MSIWQRFKSGLQKSSQRVSDGITDVFVKKRLDDNTLDAFEELLISADVGVTYAGKIRDALKAHKFAKEEISDSMIKDWLADYIANQLEDKLYKGDFFSTQDKPQVCLVVGVNGVGKTTTIAKLAHLAKSQHHKPAMAAGDTFRAAAVEQLNVWSDRLGIPFFSTSPNGDAAALAYKAYESCVDNGSDILFVDTAGRLQNKNHLMEELKKIQRVLKKNNVNAPQQVILVVDATTGQNAVDQVKVFHEMLHLTGIVITKLDGSAKGGVVLPISDLGVPLLAVGLGESQDDLRWFDPKMFANALLGKDTVESNNESQRMNDIEYA